MTADNVAGVGWFRLETAYGVYERKPAPDLDSGVDAGSREENASNKI
ncbi:hypothetical protein [Bradyrhizobium sp. dw_78]|nr:hypothetical protein [Bradyrhizobium sp. dw_78]